MLACSISFVGKNWIGWLGERLDWTNGAYLGGELLPKLKLLTFGLIAPLGILLSITGLELMAGLLKVVLIFLELSLATAIS